MKKRHQKAEKIFRDHNGILQTNQAIKLGINQRTLAEMKELGLIIRVSRGIYRLRDVPPLGYPDLVTVSLRIPDAVICLISALAIHNLTTQIPYKIYVALPQPIKRPRIEYPPIDIVWLSDKPYHAGIEERTIDSVTVRLYNREKTIADCFKFRNKIGQDIAIEALKDYMSDPGANVERVLHFSKINRVDRIIKPYIESMI